MSVDKHQRIVAVDDNEDTLEIIRFALQDHYDVMTISTPSELYEELELFEPDLLILDIMMPRVSGFQLIQMLQKHPRTSSIPIILLSAKNNPGDIKHGYKIGASLYLTKPFEPERLLRNVKTQLETHTVFEDKKYPINDVIMRLQMKSGFQKGFVKLAAEWKNDNETRVAALKDRFKNRGRVES